MKTYKTLHSLRTNTLTVSQQRDIEALTSIKATLLEYVEEGELKDILIESIKLEPLGRYVLNRHILHRENVGGLNNEEVIVSLTNIARSLNTSTRKISQQAKNKGYSIYYDNNKKYNKKEIHTYIKLKEEDIARNIGEN